jgi:polyhydroxybutyrate depolymerase
VLSDDVRSHRLQAALWRHPPPVVTVSGFRLGGAAGSMVAGPLSVAIVGGLVLGACGSSGPSAQTGSTAPPSGNATTTTAASGCSPSPSGTTTLLVRIDGRNRTVIVHLPATYTGQTKIPLVLNMHGSGSDAAQQEALTGMNATSDADGFVVVYPQGLISDGSGFDWNVPNEPLFGGRAVPANAPNDISFLVSLVVVLEHRYCIDPTRVYATGLSGGARTASQLACDAAPVFAAVAAVSGLRRPMPCPATRAVPVIAFHGSADPVDPYNGDGQAYWTYSVPRAAQYWSQQDGCSTAAVTSQPAPDVTLTSYGGCRQGAVVELYTLAGEGHEWPGGPKLPKAVTDVLGPQTNAVDANSVMWAFFAAHTLP